MAIPHKSDPYAKLAAAVALPARILTDEDAPALAGGDVVVADDAQQINLGLTLYCYCGNRSLEDAVWRFCALPTCQKQPDKRDKCDGIAWPDKTAIPAHIEKIYHHPRPRGAGV